MMIFHKNFLADELAKWREEGLVSDEAARKIAARYDIDLSGANERRSFILKLVAYLFLALSLFTLVGANWEELPRAVRLIIVLGILAAVNFSGVLAQKNGKETQATTLFFLGNFCYGAAIVLVAQIYHLGEHMPNGVLLWAVGALALALATRKSIITLQALILGLVWFLMEFEFSGVSHGFLLFIVASAAVLWRDDSRLLTGALFASVFTYIVSFVLYERYFMTDLRVDDAFYGVHFFALSYCLLAVCTSFLLERAGKFELAFYLKNIGIVCGAGILCFDMSLYEDLHFSRPWPYGTQNYENVLNGVTFLKSVFGALFVAFCAASLGLAFYFKKYAAAIVGALLVALPFILDAFAGYEEGVFSLIGVCVAVALIKQNNMKFGIVLIFWVAFVRYVDLVGDYVSASALFLVFALVVLGVSRISKKRSAR
ncbi:DUF2157 domain-containing protein [Campylobacter sp. Marseille-Q3452]|uniref:DUF2157 domain-containing protein n=1 Tax=Campylobacter massiliensis TaxID=2762557 RepID=A0A842J6B5_9BACT|nr:DUF2157 domain-containing protein [Campylobacter massiliensis]MBC2883357.1 DUF2157 domain-containing protein [Campylobacter massiliensis]